MWQAKFDNVGKT